MDFDKGVSVLGFEEFVRPNVRGILTGVVRIVYNFDIRFDIRCLVFRPDLDRSRIKTNFCFARAPVSFCLPSS